MEEIDDVAAAFLATLGPMPAMKLEKLVYYAQAWHAARTREALFAEDVEAWADGPVVDHLYQQHRGSRTVSTWTSGQPSRLSPDAVELIASVAARYGEFSGDELSELTHLETPWKATRAGLPEGSRSRRAISLDAMADYYGNQVLDAPDAVRHALANAALEGLVFPTGFDQLLAEVAGGVREGDDVVAALAAAHNKTG